MMNKPGRKISIYAAAKHVFYGAALVLVSNLALAQEQTRPSVAGSMMLGVCIIIASVLVG